MTIGRRANHDGSPVTPYDCSLQLRRCARWADERKLGRKQESRCGQFEGSDDFKGRTRRATQIDRTGGVVLHPLAKVGIGVLVSIRVSSSELMMDVLGDRKRSQCQEQSNQADREPAREYGEGRTHGIGH